MKRYYIPVAAIVLFFGVMISILKAVDTPASKAATPAKIEKALNSVNADIDSATVKFEKPHLPAAPSWGALKATTTPKLESFSFHSDPKKTSTVEKKAEKKKKKVAKKKKKPQVIVRKTKSTPENGSSTGRIADDQSYAGTLVQTGKKARNANELPTTAEEWEDYLLNPLSTDHLMTFIKYHQAKVIKDDIYNKVCEKLIASRLDDARRFGIVALGSSPSVESFTMLGQLSEVERSSALLAMIDSNYQAYLALQYVGLMTPALMSSKANVRLAAASTIGKSAQANIPRTSEPQTPNQTPGGSRGRDGEVAGLGNSRFFVGFVPVLEGVAARDQDEDVRLAAQQTLQILKSLLGPSTIAFN